MLYFALATRFPPSSPPFHAPGARFLIEAGTLALPITLGLTIAAERPLFISLSLLTGAFVVSFLPRYTVPPSPTRKSSTPLPQASGSSSQQPISIPALPSLTVYRANMMLLTIICILAVDFPVFPRALAKCESWGISIVGPYSELTSLNPTDVCVFRWTLVSAPSSSLKASYRPSRSSRTPNILPPRFRIDSSRASRRFCPYSS